MFPLGDLFGSVALAGVVAAGVAYGPGWGLGVGEVVAFVFLIGLLLNPIAELSEILDQTQIAIAGWRKVLGVLATPIDLPEPEPGVPLPHGALDVDVAGLGFAYRDGVPVLHDVEVRVPAGSSVAVVGETGSGKTTFAKLLCRLADPSTGQVRLGGVDLRAVRPDERRRAVRLVPQDGFLFDASLAENVRVGRVGSGDDEVREAFAELGLGWWLDELPLGLATPVGERGGSLSVGERQLVALRGRSSATRACWCSTKPPAPSTPRPSGRSPRRWPGWPRAGRWCRSPTGSRPPRRPTWCWCSTRDGSWSAAVTPISWPPAAPMPGSTRAGWATPAPTEWAARPTEPDPGHPPCPLPVGASGARGPTAPMLAR